MNGLEMAKKYFEAYGLPMLKAQFPHLLPSLAAGLTGSGSECYGYDDELSRDHDFEPGFCLFLPDEAMVSRKEAFALERAYAALPKSFMGIERMPVRPVGQRRGVFRISEFYVEKAGTPDGSLSAEQWLSIPDPALAEATNGAVFYDGSGQLTEIRERLRNRPEDIRRKKLCANLLLMNQSGQYNYSRCLRHGEHAAAQMAVFEYVRHCVQVVFLLNRAYMPFYKWMFRAMRALPKLSLLAEVLEYLITTDNEPDISREKMDVMKGISDDICRELIAQGLTHESGTDLQRHALSVNEGITDAGIRNMHVLSGE